MVDPLLVGLLGFVALLFFVVAGMPIAFAAALVGLGGLVFLRGWSAGVGIAGTIPHGESTHYTLSVLPMFVLIGYLAMHAGLTRGAFHTARQWFGWAPGGLAVSTVFACAGFAAVSGSSLATAAVFSRVAIPEMLRYGYDRRLAVGVVAASGTLASLIPPSTIIVIYGIIVEESIGKLLMAGFLPGIFSAVVYALMIMVRVSRNPSLGRPIRGVTWAERIAALKDTWGIILVVVIVLGGIYTGWMTPTESGAVGAAVVFLLAVMNRGLGRQTFTSALVDTSRLTVMIFSMIWGVLIFVRFLGYSGLPATFSNWVVGLPVPPVATMIGILVVYVILGMFMDAIGMLLLTLPIVHPAVIALGYDPIWFGIILVKMVEIGLITPPVGLNCYVVNGVRPDIPLETIFRSVLPFLAMDFLTVAILFAFPDIVLFLPRSMYGR